MTAARILSERLLRLQHRNRHDAQTMLPSSVRIRLSGEASPSAQRRTAAQWSSCAGPCSRTPSAGLADAQWPVGRLVETYPLGPPRDRAPRPRSVTFHSRHTVVFRDLKEKPFDADPTPLPACCYHPIRAIMLPVSRPQHRSSPALCRQRVEHAWKLPIAEAHRLRRMDDPGLR